jgi:hypothetical protein
VKKALRAIAFDLRRSCLASAVFSGVSFALELRFEGSTYEFNPAVLQN